MENSLLAGRPEDQDFIYVYTMYVNAPIVTTCGVNANYINKQ